MALPAKYAERKEGSAKVGAKIRVFQNLIYKTGYSKVQSTHLTLKPKTITVLNAVAESFLKSGLMIDHWDALKVYSQVKYTLKMLVKVGSLLSKNICR